jgi:acyl-CoA synthetase (NDP forming)
MKTKYKSLDPLLAPASIAILGASTKPGSYGLALLNMLTDGKFKGKIYPINPKYKNYKKLKFYKSVLELPSKPDNTVIAVASTRVENALYEAIRAGSKSITILADTSEEKFDINIKSIAEKAGIPICGPNSMGIHNLNQNVRISPFVFPSDLITGGVAMIIQSGSVLGALTNNDRRLRYNFFVSSGSENVTNASDYLLWCLQQPSTKVVGMFLESVRDPVKFLEGLKLAKEKNIPIVILKVGRTEASSKLALSHTGALVGDFEVFKAVLEKYNAHIVYSIDELAASLQVFSFYQNVENKGIASIHDSGGERELIVDIADDLSVPFAKLTKDTKQKLSYVLEPTMDTNNPLDAWGSGHDADQLFKSAFLHLLSDKNVSLGLYVQDWREDYYLHLMHEKIIFEIIKEAKKPVIAVSNYSMTIDQQMAKRFLENGIPLVKGTREALVAIKNLLNNKKIKFSSESHPKNKNFVKWRDEIKESSYLDPLKGYALLKDYGINVADYKVCQSISDVVSASKIIEFPLVLKTLSENLHHKTEVNGVIVNIKNLEDLKENYRDLEKRLGKKAMISKMITGGIEWSIGVKNDPDFGPAVMISLGGTMIDILDEKLILMAPFTTSEINKKLKTLRSYSLMTGYRGSKKYSIQKLCDAASKISYLAFDFKNYIKEIDINPIIVKEDNAVAVDNVFILK